MRSTFLATVLFVSLAGPVVADTCDDYAARAVARVAEAKKLGCLGMTSSDDFSEGPISIVGPRWSPNFEEHANWCRAHGSETSPFGYDGGRSMASSEENQRERGHLMCGFCNTAVTETVQQTQAAVDLKCGFTGPEWDNNSFATQMQACFKGKWYWQVFFSWPQMHYDSQDRAGKLAVCKQEKATRAKLSVGNSRYTKRPYLERHMRNGTANAVNDVAADPDCKWCKSTKSSVTGATQHGGSAMDRLGDLNNSSLGSVSGNSGSAQIGRPAKPRPTSPTTPPSTDAVVRTPPLSNTGIGGFRSKPTPNPTVRDPNPIR